MAYTAKTWVNNSAPSVCAANLNDLETGVANAHTTADAAVAKGVLQAKGDLFGALSASSPTRVVVGADDTVLVADSAQTHGLKWVQIGNAQILAAAAIAYSKLNLASSIVNADVAAGAAIAKSKLAALAVSDSDVAAGAAIAYSKLALAGSIVNADIASSASISAPKIAGFPSDSAKFLRGDATWAAPTSGGGATSATSVAALGATSDGKIGLIRAGTTPFDFVEVIYDSTYAKWVSKPSTFSLMSDTTTSISTTATTYELIHDWAGLIGNYKAIYDTSLRAQCRLDVVYYVSVNNASPGFRLDLLGVNDGEATNLAAVLESLAVLEPGATPINNRYYRRLGWQTAFSVAPTKAAVALGVTVKISSGTLYVELFQPSFRWVA